MNNCPLTNELYQELKARRPEVLVVDDDRSAGKFMEECLHVWGCNVLTCKTCNAALEIYANREVVKSELPFSMVFLDICLPNGDGVDLALEMRKHRPEQPIAIVSGLETPPDIKKFNRLDFVTFISKPDFMVAAKNLLISQGILEKA